MDDATKDDLPESYARMRSFFSEEELDSNKVLAIAVIIMAAESGFASYCSDRVYYTFDSNNITQCTSSRSVVERLRNYEEYTFFLYLGTLNCVLRMKPLCGRLVISLFAPDLLICFSEILNVSSYVTDTALNEGKLKEMSSSCKNNLFYPMKSSHSERYKQKLACLLGLPLEIVIVIMNFLHSRDFLNVCASCRYLYYNFRENGNFAKMKRK